jgi:hypothetical protein
MLQSAVPVLPAQFLASEPALKTGWILSGSQAQHCLTSLERFLGVLFSRRVATGDAKDVPNDWPIQ